MASTKRGVLLESPYQSERARVRVRKTDVEKERANSFKSYSKHSPWAAPSREDRDDGGSCRQSAFLAHPKAVLGRTQREGQRKWKLGSSLASELPLERVDVVSRIHCQYTQCRIRNVATHGRESGELRRHTSTHGNGTKADGHCLGGQQHPLHGRERSRQTNHRLQEVLVRAKSAHCSRVHYEFSVYGRSARRDSLHGNEGSRQVQLGRG
ncbi:PREDICTED: uncharacterized protein LOC105151503 isoform X1 [Acromyrmex echinatior]|uniref:uncharacterized protein LOC105151503 isoform X1 n=1 Tax=Acromyrmex echinatior TaxID=103372 RepID=UPI000580E795|nr:PREDICTED: uncharacterized protein LOC105151503 isoform X1 [Acromyrmex echinatior]